MQKSRSARFTARHRHRLPDGGYTGWSEAVPNGRHNHAIEHARVRGYVEDSVGSSAHWHACNSYTPKGTSHGYTSGPLLETVTAPAVAWLGRVLRR